MTIITGAKFQKLCNYIYIILKLQTLAGKSVDPDEVVLLLELQKNFSGSNTDGSFTRAILNWFFSPSENIL